MPTVNFPLERLTTITRIKLHDKQRNNSVNDENKYDLYDG